MKRRKLLLLLAAIPFAATFSLLTGCHHDTAQSTEQPTDAPTVAPTDAPSASPSDTAVADASPSPDASPAAAASPDDTPAEPSAPYGQLNDDQKTRVAAVTQKLAEVNGDEIKRWSDNLAYDQKGTERELRAWERIANAYQSFTQSRPNLDDGGKREAFGAILIRSMLPEEQALRYVKLSVLTADDARSAMALVNGAAASPAAPVAVASPGAAT